jgi:hypothetical protein
MNENEIKENNYLEENNKSICDECGKYVDDDEIKNGLCEECYETFYHHCDSCSEIFETDELYETDQSFFLCSDCYFNELYDKINEDEDFKKITESIKIKIDEENRLIIINIDLNQIKNNYYIKNIELKFNFTTEINDLKDIIINVCNNVINNNKMNELCN